jgi:DNA-binding response OmpR family regulator
MPADCDLLIVDEFAEGRTGCEICRIVKDNMKTANRAVILSSTTTGVEHISEMSKADGFLAKPFDINYFIALVKSFCFPDVSALSHSKLINL